MAEHRKSKTVQRGNRRFLQTDGHGSAGGISSLEGIAILRDEAESKEDAEILTLIYNALQKRDSFRKLWKLRMYFPHIFCECADRRTGRKARPGDVLPGFFL